MFGPVVRVLRHKYQDQCCTGATELAHHTPQHLPNVSKTAYFDGYQSTEECLYSASLRVGRYQGWQSAQTDHLLIGIHKWTRCEVCTTDHQEPASNFISRESVDKREVYWQSKQVAAGDQIARGA